MQLKDMRKNLTGFKFNNRNNFCKWISSRKRNNEKRYLNIQFFADSIVMILSASHLPLKLSVFCSEEIFQDVWKNTKVPFINFHVNVRSIEAKLWLEDSEKIIHVYPSKIKKLINLQFLEGSILNSKINLSYSDFPKYFDGFFL